MKFIALMLLVVLSGCGDSSDQKGTQAPPAAPDVAEAPTDTSSDQPGDSSDQRISDEDKALLKSLWFPPTIPPQPQGGVLRPAATETIYNQEGVIPPQCYTKHEGQYNPCMTCHQTYPYQSRPNLMNDGGLQTEYGFSDEGLTNHWRNLFENRQPRMADISDQAVIDYIYTDNYTPLLQKIKNSSDWAGPLPEINNLHLGAEAFDEWGIAKDGSHWVAFNYKPFPSTFWPTNGSTDDVMIRLAEPFRTSLCQSGYSRDTYLANLAILEAAIKDLAVITTPPIDERAFCKDLNGDGALGVIEQIVRPETFVGQAESVKVTPMLYPQGTEFLHTVRYVGISPQGDIGVSPRMKEVRYMNKHTFFDTPQLTYKYGNERQEKIEGQLPLYTFRQDKGTDNDFGWMLLGFIEDKNGSLRQQSEEENLFCMGCHTTLGSTIDQTFAFSRKVTGKPGWRYINLHGMVDAPYVGGTTGEIAHYLNTVGGGDEFRQNREIQQKFFDEQGQLRSETLAGLDVYQLITPSLRRALDLNKAYMTIVQDQDFIHGRDANLAPAENVYHQVDPDTAATLPPEKTKLWDIRLQW